jgi:hypothetical protein
MVIVRLLALVTFLILVVFGFFFLAERIHPVRSFQYFDLPLNLCIVAVSPFIH